MTNDIFNLDDLFDSDGDGRRDMSGAVGFAIRLILAATTAGFFYTYAGSLFAWLVGPELSPYLSAMVGTFCIDFMAWFWDRQRKTSADTLTQINIAKWATIGDLTLSIMVTSVFFLLNTEFLTGEQLMQALNLAGAFIGIMAMGGNGLAWAYFTANSSESRQAINNAGLKAAQMKGAHVVNENRARLQISRTIDGIQRQLPEVTAQAANDNTESFFRHRYNTPTGEPEADTDFLAQKAVNGHGQT